eukprot:m.317766 g.317766  ORF g.317766 m.317766 type:complete len:199 (-) comp27561_c0_seq1:171-767(-)
MAGDTAENLGHKMDSLQLLSAAEVSLSLSHTGKARPKSWGSEHLSSGASSHEPERENLEHGDFVPRRAGLPRKPSRNTGSSKQTSVSTRWLRKEKILGPKQTLDGWPALSLNFRFTSTRDFEVTVSSDDHARARFSLEEVTEAMGEEGTGVISFVGLHFMAVKLNEFLNDKFMSAKSLKSSPRIRRREVQERPNAKTF